MRRHFYPMRSYLVFTIVLAAFGALSSEARPQQSSFKPALQPLDFKLAAPQGFGDRQNSWVWSMQWWKGHLYVGTNRAWQCVESAAYHNMLPQAVPYPPDDPDLACPADPLDLPLQAEIWRWSAANDKWERVFQSPADFPVPGQPGTFIARDIGYRGMTVFTEADGTEALYVTALSPQLLGYPEARPRILRSTDGVTFQALPQNPGTVLGDLPWSSLRSPLAYNGRLYVIAGTGQGSGVLLEAEHPARGDDNFRNITPPGSIVSAAAVFNGFLYIGLRSATEGYRVVKTDASGDLPYTYDVVVPAGGFLRDRPNSEVLSMQVFEGRLYVGGNGVRSGLTVDAVGAAELVRINPDDSWELVVGNPRMGPTGMIFPLSGHTSGFGSPYNIHIWQMAVFDGRLYIGTFDSRTLFKDDPRVDPLIRDQAGFDLYRSSDGVRFEPVTVHGLGDRFNTGVRGLEATPYGLFLGTSNQYYGLQIWRADPDYALYLPALGR